MDKKSTPLPETNQDLTTKALDSDKEQVQEDSAENVLTSAEESSLKEERFDEDTPSEKASESVEEVSSEVAAEEADDMPADTAAEKEAEDSADTTSENATEEENFSSKGSAVKKALGVLIVAALAGGAYYAQQNHFFGLLGDSANEQSAATEVGSSGEQSAATEAASSGEQSAATEVSSSGEQSATPEVASSGEQSATPEAASTGEQATAPESESSTSDASTTPNVSTAELAPSESSSEPTTTEPATTDEQSVSTEAGAASEQATTAGNESSAPEASTAAKASTAEPSVSVEVTSEPSSATTASSTSETTVDAPVAKMPEQAEVHDSAQTEAELQRKVASIRLAEVLNLYQAADFERSVRVSKENTLKALDLLKKHVALQSDSLWKPVLEAVNRDEQTLKNSADIDLDKLFKATDELAKLVKQAHFMSAETGEVILHPESEKSVVSEEAKPGAWLDLAINQVERLPSQAYEAIRSDLGGLIRVEKLSDPEVATLPVERLQQLRQETLLQVSIAQEALLKRQQAIWQEATGKIEQLLSTYYNTGLESTQQALALARQLMKTSIQSELPALDNTHQALEQLTRQLHINK